MPARKNRFRMATRPSDAEKQLRAMAEEAIDNGHISQNQLSAQTEIPVSTLSSLRNRGPLTTASVETLDALWQWGVNNGFIIKPKAA